MRNDQNVINILDKLYALGMDYLYGMLFHELFTFQSSIYPPEFDDDNDNNNSRLRHSSNNDSSLLPRTYALHSRHYNSADTGRDTKKEKDCLHSILDQRELGSAQKSSDFQQSGSNNDDGPPCIVYLLSDREITIKILNAYIGHNWPNCRGISATHAATANTDNNNTSGKIYKEHGTWAGSPFFSDLILASKARDGFIVRQLFCNNMSVGCSRFAIFQSVLPANNP
jgi:hypothetical protein